MKYELASSTWGSEEISALNKVVESGKFTMGSEVLRFEADFARSVKSDFSVMFNSGSSANLALLAALRYLNQPLFNPGDEIIVPAVSWSTTYYPVHQLGGVLRFVDVDSATLNIDPTKIEEAVNEKTKGIFVVNLLGNPAPWDKINEIAQKHNLFVIEDNSTSVLTNTREVWGSQKLRYEKTRSSKVVSYKYINNYPHSGAGMRVQF